MTPTNNKILVRCDLNQKDSILIGDKVFSMALLFESNYREKSPVLCTVVEGNEIMFEGDVLLCHHNLFYSPSPYHVEDDLYSIPFSSVIFAKIRLDGSLFPVCGNLLCDRVGIPTTFSLPSDAFHEAV
jgi:hypothetical protein